MQYVFDRIYEQQLWGPKGDGSGPGSDIDNTKITRHVLKNILLQNNISLLIDVSCGSCIWIADLLHDFHNTNTNIIYRGFDVSPVELKRARRNIARYNMNIDVILRKADFTTCTFSQNVVQLAQTHKTLVLCRDTFQHMPLQDIKRGIQNLFKNFPSALHVYGGYIHNHQNIDIPLAGYFSINYSIEPFNMKPHAILRETDIKGEPTKYLFLFTKKHDCDTHDD